MPSANIVLRPERVRAIVQGILAAHGVPADEAAVVADVLVRADLRGIESHGVARLEKYYVSRLRLGVVKPVCSARVVRETPVSAVMDAGEGLGHVTAKRAMELCISKALVSGMGAVTVNHSNHFGIAGYYAMMALPHDLIGIALTNGSATVAPTYSRQRLLGTNPIAVAVPAGDERPFVLDMATTVAAEGKIEVQDRQGLPLPHGWIVDKQGRPSTVSADFYGGGALMPLGGDAEGASYKGYGLGLLVDILSGILAGAASSSAVLRSGPDQPKPVGLGHFFAALRIDLFRAPAEFKAAMDNTMRTIRNSALAPGASRIYIAGQKEWEAEIERERNGIPYGPAVTQMLQRLAGETGVVWGE